MMKRQLTYFLASLAGMLLLSGCHPCVYEDLSDCPQGVDFGFYVQSPCAEEPSYPSEIRQARLFAFDEQGRLVREIPVPELKLSKDFLLRTDYYRVGKSDFVAWAGGDLSLLDFGSFTPGTTTKEQMIVALKRQAESFAGLIPPIYVGRPDKGTLTQEDRSALGTFYDRVDIHLEQITNRLRITLTGLDPEHKYSVRVEDSNSKYHIDGTFAPDTRFSYLPEDLAMEGRTVTATIDVMRLATGRGALLIVTDETDGREIMRKNLVEDLLLARTPDAAARPYSLECDHLFDIRIDFDLDLDKDTYVAVRATINKWNIVFRDVILG